jgi:2-methylcitrate dehydratase PrpD
MEKELLGFIMDMRYDALPPGVRHQLVRALGDLLAAALAGLRTPTSRIMAGYAARCFPGIEATVFGAGRACNAAGAALANACTSNALDIDDGFRPAKGHPGAVTIPAALAQAEAVGASGAAFLAAVAVGYEIGMRAGVAWHRTRPAFCGSGAWGSIGAAAACAALLGLNASQTRHALGIAEYHTPYASIMDAVEHPAMVKDGIHWGSFAGLTAAQLARVGFTGIPPLLTLPAQSDLVSTLGREWLIERLYFKFFPCCRWAQPAVAGVLALRERYGIAPEAVDRVCVEAFDAATHLITRHPRNTEEAQYSLPFPVACALVRGRVTPEETVGDGLDDPAILELAERVEMKVDRALEARFPLEALEHVTILLKDGREYCIGPLGAPGDAGAPPTDETLAGKFFDLTIPVLGPRRAERLHETIAHCHELDTISELTALLGPV